MQAVILNHGQYEICECAKPSLAAEEVLIKVAYAGLNRADLFQKEGKYPLPEKTPAIPGMEVSGEVVACGSNVKAFKPGDKVCALMSEGAFAEYTTTHESITFPLPEALSLEQGAALMEAIFTVWISLAWHGKIQPGESFLVHGGASGIGIVAIQVAKLLGARVFATAGTPEKCAACVKAGAEKAIHYHTEDYVEQIKALTQGKGVDVILDMVGGDYFARNLEVLALDGRLSIIAFLRGPKVTANLSPILLKRLSVSGSTLRSRTVEVKAQIAKEIRNRLWINIEKGKLNPVIDEIFPLTDIEKALARMQQGLNIGKILIRM